MTCIEPLTPYADSLMWKLHHAYFAQRGAKVWTKREIPSQGTSNHGQAKDHVRLLRALASDRVGPLNVLEVGSGAGEFAANFMDAVRSDAPDLLPRVRFHLTDYVPATVDETVKRPRVAPWVASGHIVPAVFDVTKPDSLPGPFALVIANYVCCAIAMRPLQKWGDVWREPWVETHASIGDTPPEDFVAALTADATRPDLQSSLDTRFEWRETALYVYLDGPLHAEVVRRATADCYAATLFYPRIFLDFMRRVPLADHGLVVINDYGYLTTERIRGLHERRPENFANCLGQEVQFVIFDAFGEVAGWSVHRSNDPLDEVHRAVLSPKPFGPAVAATLANRGLWGRPDWAHLLDFQGAALVLEKAGDRERALRFWLRCAEIDPSYPDFRYNVGENAIEVQLPKLAIEHLLIGRELDPESHDWEFMLGRAEVGNDDIPAARSWYKQALAREPDATTHANLGALALGDQDFGGAFRHLEKALALEPEHARARELMDELRERVWEEAELHFRDEMPIVAEPDEEE